MASSGPSDSVSGKDDHVGASTSASALSGSVLDSEESDSTDGEEGHDTTTSGGSSSTAVISLLDRLKASKKSELTRKRKIFTNPQQEQGSHKKRPSCSSNPKSVTPVQRVREFPNACFTVSARTLFCDAYRQEVSLRCSIIKNHIASSKHSKMKNSLKERKQKDEDNIAKRLKLYDKEQHPSGECLPEKQIIYRIKVLSSFLNF